MFKRLGSVVVVAVLNCQLASAADGATNDKAAVEAVIKGLYAKKISDLEQRSGRANIARSCEYLRTVFEAEMLSQEANCAFLGRFPNLSAEDFFLMSTDKVAPRGAIVQTRVEGGEAVVKVKAPIREDLQATRIVYFMRKSEAGWRVSNMMTYRVWPIDLDESRNCTDFAFIPYEFDIPPKRESDFEDLPPPCRKLAIDKLHRNGWSK